MQEALKTLGWSQEEACEAVQLATNIASRYNIRGSNKEDTEKLAYEPLFEAAKEWVGGKSQTGEGDFKSYASTFIRNFLNKEYNKAKKDSEKVVDLPPSEEASESVLVNWFKDHLRLPYLGSHPPGVMTSVRRREILDVLEPVIAMLEPREQVILEKVALGMSFTEIGEQERPQISKQRVSQILDRIRDKLKPELKKRGVIGVGTKGDLRS